MDPATVKNRASDNKNDPCDNAFLRAKHCRDATYWRDCGEGAFSTASDDNDETGEFYICDDIGIHFAYNQVFTAREHAYIGKYR